MAEKYRCNKCHRPMKGSTAYDGACECGGLIESVLPINSEEFIESMIKPKGKTNG